MARSTRGKRDGTGPFRDSYQKSRTGGSGKRQQSGQKCPKEKE